MNEKFYTIPLGSAYSFSRTKRVRKTLGLIREFIARHSKAPKDAIKLSNALNLILWKRGIQKPPRKIRIKLIVEDGIVKAYLADEKIKKTEIKKEDESAQKQEEKTTDSSETKEKSAHSKPEVNEEIKQLIKSEPVLKEQKEIQGNADSKIKKKA